MNWFLNRSTMTKLVTGFSALSALMAVMGWVAASAMADMNQNTAELYEKHLKGMHAVDETSTAIAMVGRSVRVTLLASGPDERKKSAAQARQLLQDVQTKLNAVEPLLTTPEARQKLGEVKAAAAVWLAGVGRANDLAEGGRDKEAHEVLRGTITEANQLIAAMAALGDNKVKVSQRAYDDSASAYQAARRTLTGVVAGGVVGGLLLGFFIARLITVPLGRCAAVLGAVARGDLSQRADVRTSDEIGQMSASLNVAVDALVAAKEAERVRVEQDRVRAEREAAAERERVEREAAATRAQAEREAAAAAELARKVAAVQVGVTALAAGDFTVAIPNLGDDNVGQMAAGLNKAIVSVRAALEGVREVSEQLADASGQLASASEEISTGAQEQASSLEETASTLEQITATVKQSADNAQQARQLASSSRDVAEKGGTVVSSAVDAMSEINASSKKIADIITTIDEIAFQTNLLALNAAVEAARAGEQGRGFAVVASEVRNLAQRSATAAKEIKSLISDSVRKVDAGTELVNKSGATLDEIVTSVKRVTDIVTDIAAASREQSTGIDQVNKAVGQMDSVTQRNASQTEEMSATAQALTDQASQLRDLVARFKLSGTAPTRAPARHAPRPVKKPAAPKSRPAARAMSNGHSNGNGHAHELDALGGSDTGFTEF